jgi:hypothetical protein
VYPSEVVAAFELKTSVPRWLSLGEKWLTRRVDGVEGLMMLPDAVFMEIT